MGILDEIDIDISREEMLRLGRERPFLNFIQFPIEVKTAMEVFAGDTCNWHSFLNGANGMGPKPEPVKMFLSDKTYSFPKNYNFTEKIDTTPLKLETIKSKETYISPFTGRVM